MKKQNKQTQSVAALFVAAVKAENEADKAAEAANKRYARFQKTFEAADKRVAANKAWRAAVAAEKAEEAN